MSTQTGNNIRVGIFVAAGLITAVILTFIVGAERHMFSSKRILHTTFRNVGGLRTGSPVRMGGITIGSVVDVRFGSQANDPLVHVDFQVVEEAMVRIKSDSRATLASKGLLGDKALDITMGSLRAAAPPNNTIAGVDEEDMFATVGHIAEEARASLRRAQTALDNVAAATQPLANPQLGQDIIAITRNVRTLSDSLASGQGTAGRLINDGALAGRIDGLLAEANNVLHELRGAASQADALVRDARTGRGLVHALVYDERGANAVASLGRAADELSAITHDIREGQGGLHEIIYGNDSSQLVASLRETAVGVRDIVRDIQRGRGTIGALLTDSSLFDDIKALVGNVQRNEILRAMVRYSIQANDRAGQGTVQANPGGSTPPAQQSPNSP